MEEDAEVHAEGELHEGTEVAHGPTEAEAGGMPQLNPDFFGNQIFWLLVSLAAIWLMLTRVALPRLGSILAARSGGIAGDLAAAEALRAQAREAEAAHDRALAEARAEAGRIAAAARAEVQAGLDADLARADAQIDAKAAEGARRLSEIAAESEASVAAVARDAARAIVEAMGGQADPATVDAAVARRLGG